MHRTPSTMSFAPIGRIMNSWIARSLPACSPPLITFDIGTGSRYRSSFPSTSIRRYSKSSIPRCFAAATAAPIETDRIAFAPSLPLPLLGSSLSSLSSISFCDSGSAPFIASRIVVLTFFTAWDTPFPRYRAPPSRNSTASFSPVDAPLGTFATPIVPSVSSTFVMTVGFPRESRISSALILLISTNSITVN